MAPFLCPAVSTPLPYRPSKQQAKCFSSFHKRCQDAAITAAPLHQPEANLEISSISQLPLCCPGCGAFSQTTAGKEAGFYNIKRNAVKAYLRQESAEADSADDTYKQAIERADPKLLKTLGLGRVPQPSDTLPPAAPPPPPVCDRCHDLIHYHKGVSIHHPSIEAIADTIAESPHKHNHIYHVLDAADFPMSLVPQLRRHLSLSRQRSRNRRSRVKGHYTHGGLAEMSFIITRSDLLAPKKEMVDKMMPQLLQILRDALGREGQGVRLGNVRCVSAKRGWWTKDVKEAIWKRGGGGWMVGKVNVGKSNLFEAVFPKGRGGQAVDIDKLRRDAAENGVMQTSSTGVTDVSGGDRGLDLDELPFQTGPNSTETSPEPLDTFFEVDSLLPPPPKEVPFPQMPLISSLPGTTASPIRVPFGDGKGELIDLPGLDRATLETYVKAEHRLDLIMTSRSKAERLTLKPGQSLLLDGLVRITPTFPADTIFMTHSFVPLKSHVTATGKALEVEAGARAPALGDRAIADLGKIQEGGGLESAGKFKLKWDVTRAHAGPLVRKDAVGLKAEKLPWITYAADILIEGCGWVEVVVEVRKRRKDGPAAVVSQNGAETLSNTVVTAEQLPTISHSDRATSEFIAAFPLDGKDAPKAASAMNESHFPEVEVFAPEGRFIAVRRPLNAWLVGGVEAKPKKTGAKSRPRRSMRSFKERRMPASAD